jgi:hypothetical protein
MKISSSWHAALLSAADALRQEMMLQAHAQTQTQTPALTQMRDGELCSPIASQEQGMVVVEEEWQCSDPEPNSPSCYLRDFSSFGSSSEPESEPEPESDAHSQIRGWLLRVPCRVGCGYGLAD